PDGSTSEFSQCAGPTSTAPETTLTGHPSDLETTGAATFSFSSPDAGSTFECALDSAAFTACTSPKSYSGLADTVHTFQVRAIAASTPDATPARWVWSIDSVSPPAGSALDQHNGVSRNNTGDTVGGGSGIQLAQVFTAGTTGALKGVAASLGCGTGPSQDVTIQIQGVLPAGTPNGDPVATSTA